MIIYMGILLLMGVVAKGKNQLLILTPEILKSYQEIKDMFIKRQGKFTKRAIQVMVTKVIQVNNGKFGRKELKILERILRNQV